ncbi:MAG: hypothetical protein PF517_15410 [Salinivirgaceae bacterium]|jgi:hypothetical protein|nr:hypothetical protein [Salinivirgaceae bacterium]
MNALYLILIALGFSAGVMLTTLNTNNKAKDICIEENEKVLIEENTSFDVETESQTYFLFNKYY